MPASLLDVNVLVALFDQRHVHHTTALEWMITESGEWATCPVTAMGLMRILCNPRYPEALTTETLAIRLRKASAQSDHRWWPSDISIADEGLFDLRGVQGHRQLTDVYLLALAVKHKGQLVTFDRTIPWRAVRGAKASHLKVLGQRQ